MDISRASSCTYPLREQAVDYALSVMAEAGLAKVDLWGGPPHFSIVSVQCDLAELRDKAAAAGIRVANIGAYPGRGFASPDPTIQAAELAALEATLYAAQALGARSIRILPGDGEDPAAIDRIAPLFARGAELAEKLGVYMGMENHGGSLAGVPEHARRLCQAVGSRYFGVLYEPANLLHAGVDYQEAFEVFADHIVHIHLKDGKVTPDGFERTHLGAGDINYAWVLAQMESIGYGGDYALEYEICDLEPIETGMVKWVDYFRALEPERAV